MNIQVNGIEIEIERKNIKNINLSVCPPNARVHISAPINCEDKYLELFVLRKWDWIENKRKKILSFDYQPKREFVSGEDHYFLGERYRLKVNRAIVANSYSVQKVADYIVINVGPNTTNQNIEKLLYIWYKDQLQPILEYLISKWQPILRVKLSTWQIRYMTSRWGSCRKSTATATFNTELAKEPLSCIEYVVVHELAHLIEANHSERFYRILSENLPQYRELEKRLNNKNRIDRRNK